MSLVRAVIDGIECLTLIRPNTKKTVMLLHGFGADMNDLAPLHTYLDPKGNYNWVFPNGIRDVPIGPHVTGKAWFPIRMADIEAAAMRGDVVDFAGVFPDGMAEAEYRIKSLIKNLRIDLNDLVLGGFSQGAMMTCQVALTSSDDVRGMILLSATTINLNAWEKSAAEHKAVPFIQSHGREDPILGFKHAERLFATLTTCGLKGHFIPFQGFHEIPLPVIREVAKFLETISKPSA